MISFHGNQFSFSVKLAICFENFFFTFIKRYVLDILVFYVVNIAVIMVMVPAKKFNCPFVISSGSVSEYQPDMILCSCENSVQKCSLRYLCNISIIDLHVIFLNSWPPSTHAILSNILFGVRIWLKLSDTF